MPQTALVTGASSGLGRELVRQLVRDRGMNVLATARRLDRLEELAAELPAGRVQVLAGDLDDPEFRAQLWARAEAIPGGLDLLVNNAGLGDYADFAEQDPAVIRRIMETNVMALLDLTQRGVRHMKARGAGQIVEISSVLGFVGLPYSAVYSASKHAVIGLVKSLRHELRGSGVRIWAACPGRTKSEFSNVASGREKSAPSLTPGAPTEKVVRAIVRGIDGRRTFLIPGLVPRGTVAVAHWLPGLFAWLMDHRVAARFRAEMVRGKESTSPSAP